MATIQKGAKIDLYKFVPVTLASASTANPDDSDPKLTEAALRNVQAVNSLGKTVNGLAKVVVDIKKITHASLTAQQKALVKLPKPKFNKPAAQFGNFFTKMGQGKVPGFLESLLKLLGGLFKILVVRNILKWLSNPKNQKAVEKGIEVLAKMLKIVASWAKFGTNMAFNGLYEMLADDSTWWERLMGFGKFIVGIGTILLPLRWLTIGGAAKLIGDLKFSLTALKTGIVGIKGFVATAAAGPLGFLFVAGGAIAFGLLVNKLFKGKEAAEARIEADQLKRDKLTEEGNLSAGEIEQLINDTRIKDVGGPNSINHLWQNPTAIPGDYDWRKPFLKGGKLAEFAGGGWIHGPQSGYPVSLDGNGPDFIGHGSEYVARKGDGTSFIIPFDTKATRTNPNLTNNRLREAKQMGYDVSGLSRAVGGALDRQIYLHWTGTGYNFKKKGAYHSIFQGSGEKYQAHDYNEGTNHTYKRNTGNVGLAAASMAGRPWRDYPPTTAQMTAMTKEAAKIALSWGWKPGDVTNKRVMTHAEAASNRDGRNLHDNYGPVMWGGTGERWDFFKVRKGDPDGSGGMYLRNMIRNFMSNKGAVRGKGKNNAAEMDLLQRLVLAEAGGEGTLGMALVARSVLNRAGLVQGGSAPGLFNAQGGTITDIIMGKGQYQPIADGSIRRERTDREMQLALDAINLARNPKSLRSRLIAAGYDESMVNKLMGATGFRTGGAFNDPSQNVNTVKMGGHVFNSAGNTDLRVLTPEVGSGGTGGGHGSSGSTVESILDKKRKHGGQWPPKSGGGLGGGGFIPSGSGGGSPSNRSRPTFTRNDSKDQAAMKKATDDRNRARREMNRKTIEIVQAVLAQVERSNEGTKSWIAQANAAATAILNQSDTPTFVGGGGGGGGGYGGGGGATGPFASSSANKIFGVATTVLNSFNNPLRGLFR